MLSNRFTATAVAVAATALLGMAGQAHAVITVDPGPVGPVPSGMITFSTTDITSTISTDSGSPTTVDDIFDFVDGKSIRFDGTEYTTTIEFVLSGNAAIAFEPLQQDITVRDAADTTLGPDIDTTATGPNSFSLIARRLENATTTPPFVDDIFSIVFGAQVSADTAVSITEINVKLDATNPEGGSFGTFEIIGGGDAAVPVPATLPLLLGALGAAGWVSRRRAS
ncbi:MAG: PEP-CTERM sorting domain-containing protein [Pseudomonadota bacterium]